MHTKNIGSSTRPLFNLLPTLPSTNWRWYRSVQPDCLLWPLCLRRAYHLVWLSQREHSWRNQAPCNRSIYPLILFHIWPDHPYPLLINNMLVNHFHRRRRSHLCTSACQRVLGTQKMKKRRPNIKTPVIANYRYTFKFLFNTLKFSMSTFML